MPCPLSVTNEFKKLAITTFGVPSKWSEADVATLGKIVGETQVVYFSFYFYLWCLI